MTLYVDNDAFTKLCRLGIFDEALAALGVSPTSVFVLDTYQFQLRKKLAAFRGLIEPALAKVSKLTAAACDDIVQQLSGIPNLDAGEVLLFAQGIVNSESRVVTGDKRALRALVKVPACAAQLAGRVVCFEQVVKRTIESGDFSSLLPRITQGRDCDTGVKVAFGSGMQTSSANAAGTLQSYIDGLRAEAGDLLAP